MALQFSCIWYILWPVCSNFATVRNPQLRLWQHVALGGICKAMTLLHFYSKQKILDKNNIQYWNDSIYLTHWARQSSWNESWNRKKQHAEIASVVSWFSRTCLLLVQVPLNKVLTSSRLFHRWILTGEFSTTIAILKLMVDSTRGFWGFLFPLSPSLPYL